jgi:hypothetical protein
VHTTAGQRKLSALHPGACTTALLLHNTRSCSMPRLVQGAALGAARTLWAEQLSIQRCCENGLFIKTNTHAKHVGSQESKRLQ